MQGTGESKKIPRVGSGRGFKSPSGTSKTVIGKSKSTGRQIREMNQEEIQKLFSEYGKSEAGLQSGTVKYESEHGARRRKVYELKDRLVHEARTNDIVAYRKTIKECLNIFSNLDYSEFLALDSEAFRRSTEFMMPFLIISGLKPMQFYCAEVESCFDAPCECFAESLKLIDQGNWDKDPEKNENYGRLVVLLSYYALMRGALIAANEAELPFRLYLPIDYQFFNAFTLSKPDADKFVDMFEKLGELLRCILEGNAEDAREKNEKWLYDLLRNLLKGAKCERVDREVVVSELKKCYTTNTQVFLTDTLARTLPDVTSPLQLPVQEDMDS